MGISTPPLPLRTNYFKRRVKMNKIQKGLYQAPELTKLELNSDLSILLHFSISGGMEDVAPGYEDRDESDAPATW